LTYINIFANEVKSPRGAVGAQIADLQFATLVLRADTGVDSDSHNSVLRGRERNRLISAHGAFLSSKEGGEHPHLAPSSKLPVEQG
jgi:hypothetical protein